MSKEGALQILKNNTDRFKDEEIKTAFKKWNDRVVQYVFTDTDEIWSIHIIDGGAELKEGKITDKPALEYTMTTETLEKMASGEISGMKAYQMGLIQTKGAIRDMLKWKKISTVTVEN
jgi:putative sterol carrier protein